MVDKALQKFAARAAEVAEAVYRRRQPLPALRLAPEGVVGPRPGDGAAAWPPVLVGGHWGGVYGQTWWFHGDVAIPDDWAGEAVVLLVRLGDYATLPGEIRMAGPEGLAYLDGVPFAGVDYWHGDLLLTPRAGGGERHALALEVYGGRTTVEHTLRQYELATRDAGAAGLAADLRAASEALAVLDPEGADAALLTRALDAALALVDFRRPRSAAFYASLAPAREAFAAALRDYQHGSRPRVVATGHAHIDVAWLWPLAQTRRKAARTFATALRLMEEYPEYHFTQSQPQLYQYVKEDEPALYEQIKARVAEGRWEPTGAMWLEADTNVPSGESLVRQLVHGMRFFEREFGTRSTILWLPDVFGYSWALPQLLRGVGIRHFMTSKISWSDTNKFPYDTFRWRGTDGSEVLTHFITTPDPGDRYYTYNGHMSAAEVAGTPRIYRQKAINDEVLYLFGWGDGGGGPTRAMLDAGRRLGGLPGMPALEQGSAEGFFDRLAARVFAPEHLPQLPIWEGELYLEFHRGTYTSQGPLKYAHRRAEVLLHDAEFWLALAHARDAALPGTRLDAAWQLLLLQQFHDILPGSSIHEVYEDMARDLARVAGEATAAIDAGLVRLAGEPPTAGSGLLIGNSLPWVRHDPVVVGREGDEPAFVAEGEALTVQAIGDEPGGKAGWLVAPPTAGVPALGYLRATRGRGTPATRGGAPVEAGERVLENGYYRLELDERGLIRSLRDKRRGDREVIADGGRGNRLIAFEDKPIKFDAWDIDLFYQQKPYPLDELDELRVIERGPLRAGVAIRRRFLDSTIAQRLYLYRDLPRIDIVTDIDWREHQILLKAAFPVAIHAGRATYEIQFGNVERPTHWNTSWDRARFEVCAQRWVDLSEGDYGVALLNDGKYGHDIRGNAIRLTLLKSGIHPDPNADQGHHHCTYSLLPHPGDWRGGAVIAHAAALNAPLRAAALTDAPGDPLAARFSLVACDRPGLAIDTVKPAADGRGIVLRLYEGHGTRGRATLRFGYPVAWAEECNLLEERTGEVALAGADGVRIDVRPYELKTLRVGLR